MKDLLIITVILCYLADFTLCSSSSEEEHDELVLFRKSGILQPSTFLVGNTQAKELKLKQCNYERISANSFTPLVSLKELEIDRSSVGELSQGAFNGCNNLKEIVIKNSIIDNMSSKVFNNLLNVKKLKIKTTKIGDLKQNMFLGCSNMEEFTCEECQIENVEDGAMDGLRNLRELDLQKNGMKKFSFSVLPVMQNLKKINLGGNPLLDLDITDIETKCPNLEVLKLKGVNLSRKIEQQLETLNIRLKKI